MLPAGLSPRSTCSDGGRKGPEQCLIMDSPVMKPEEGGKKAISLIATSPHADNQINISL